MITINGEVALMRMVCGRVGAVKVYTSERPRDISIVWRFHQYTFPLFPVKASGFGGPAHSQLNYPDKSYAGGDPLHLLPLICDLPTALFKMVHIQYLVLLQYLYFLWQIFL